MKVAIIIPTWNNLRFLVHTILSLKERTEGVDYRIICVPNGCNDGTVQWLQKQGIEFFELGAQAGFIKATNAGLRLVEPGEHVLLLNDDVKITDPLWLARMVEHFQDPTVGAVGPLSNQVLGVQHFTLNNLPMIHEAPFLIGFCMLIRAEAFAQIGLLDESFGVGTNEDLDYSLLLRKAGYQLIVDRRVFVFHVCSTSLLRVAKDANLDTIQKPTRETLIAKWGNNKLNAMFREMEAIQALSRSSQEISC